jgi:carbonic anhydrase
MLSGAREGIRARHAELGREAFLEMELEGVRISLKNLRSFPWVRAREAAGRLKLHGAYFAISDGILHICDETSGAFAPA